MTRRFAVTIKSDSDFDNFDFIDVIRNELAGDDADVSVIELKATTSWIEREYGMYYECSNCNKVTDIPTQYCKHCGFRMKDVEGRI